MRTISSNPLAATRRLPNLFDLAAMVVLFAVIVAVANSARSTLGPLNSAQATIIHLDPSYLPGYALRTTLRMFAALRRVAALHLHLCAPRPPRAGAPEWC